MQRRAEPAVKVDLPVSGLAAMCSLDHGGSSFSDSQEAVNAIAHFTVELRDGGPFERIALVRHELEAVEWCVCWASARLWSGARSARRMRREGDDADFQTPFSRQFTGSNEKGLSTTQTLSTLMWHG